jgi:hypothetical protein
MRKIYPVILTLFLIFGISNATFGTDYPDDQWSPDNGMVFINSGSNEVNIDSYISWDTAWDLTYLHDSETETFELDVVMYDGGYASGYTGVWDTSLPSGYLDSSAFDDPSTPVFTVGSKDSHSITYGTIYYLNIDAYRNTSNSSSPVSVNSQRGRCLGPLFCSPGLTIFAYESDIIISKSAGKTAPGTLEWGDIFN